VPRARNGHTTALFTDECQSFLDNVIAGLGKIGAWNDPRGSPKSADTERLVVSKRSPRRPSISQLTSLLDQVASNCWRSRREIPASMSHEVRTPLNSIIGLTEMMSIIAVSSRGLG
jgi:signal transduction histidine kinase